jgi:hypothetical protein
MILAAKLILSLFAVVALGWLARRLGLGEEARIRDEDHAKAIAFDALYGFEAIDVAVDRAGYAALLKDRLNRHALICAKGGNFVARLVLPPVEGRLDQKLLTIDLQEPDFDPITLNLGEAAQYWASGLRHIPTGAAPYA